MRAIICIHCGVGNESGRMTCSQCGAPLPIRVLEEAPSQTSGTKTHWLCKAIIEIQEGTLVHWDDMVNKVMAFEFRGQTLEISYEELRIGSKTQHLEDFVLRRVCERFLLPPEAFKYAMNGLHP